MGTVLVPFAVEEETNFDVGAFGFLPFGAAVMVSRFEREEGSSVEPHSMGKEMVLMGLQRRHAIHCHLLPSSFPASSLWGLVGG